MKARPKKLNIKIRKATLKDLKSIQDLNYKLFEKEFKECDSSLNMKWTYSKDGTSYYKRCINGKKDCAFVAEINNKIVGYLVGGKIEDYFYRTLKNTTELSNMFVLKKYQSKGIGTKLINEFLKWSKQKKAECIKVEVSPPNKKAIKFYKKKGFKENSLILEINKKNKKRK